MTALRVALVLAFTAAPAAAELTANAIDSVVRSRARAIRRCYQDEAARNSKLGDGKITVRFRIEVDGRVSEARVKASTLGDATVETCVVKQVEQLKFPKHDAAAVVSYPFVFTKANP